MKKTFSSYILMAGIFLAILAGASSCAVSTGASTGNPFTLVSSWTGSLGEVVTSIYVDGTNTYATVGADGLYIFNTGLTYLTKFATNNYPFKDVVVKSFGGIRYAVLAMGINSGKGGTMMVSVSDLTNFAVTNFCELTGKSPNAIFVGDEVTNVYSADQFLGFVQYTNAWNSGDTLTNKFASLSSPGSDIAVSGARTYIAAKTGGVFVLDQSVNNGILANITSTLLIANAVAVSGSGNGTLLAVGDSLGLIVYNMASPDSPSSPRYLGGYYGSPVYDVVINGNDIYLALGTAGVVMLTYSAPSTFTLAKQYSDGGFYNKLYYNGVSLYASCQKDGIRVLR